MVNLGRCHHRVRVVSASCPRRKTTYLKTHLLHRQHSSKTLLPGSLLMNSPADDRYSTMDQSKISRNSSSGNSNIKLITVQRAVNLIIIITKQRYIRWHTTWQTLSIYPNPSQSLPPCPSYSRATSLPDMPRAKHSRCNTNSSISMGVL